MSYLIGLTGGIGSGKSAAAALFAELGAAVIDTDAIAHELTGSGAPAIESIRQAFGDAMIAPDGSLERAAMRRLVFSDAAAKRRLEAILHPLIRAEVETRCRRSSAPYIVLVVPLLVETGFYGDRLDRTLVIDCGEQTQVARAMARSGLSAAQVNAIMAAQARRGQRLAVADDVIGNDEDIAALRREVLRMHECYLRLSGKG